MSRISYIVPVLVIAILLAILATALPTVDEVVEEVDIRGFKYAKSRIALTIPSSYLRERRINEETLRQLCRKQFATGGDTTFLNCEVRISDKEGGRSEVSFTIFDQPRFTFKDLTFLGDRLKLDVLFEHKPKQFVFTRGYRVLSRQLDVVYPTHRTVLEHVGESTFSSSFSLVGEPGPLSFSPEQDSYMLGQFITIPKLEGELCAAALVKDDVVVAKLLSVLCRPTALATSAFLEPGEYELFVVSYRLGKLSLAKSRIRLTDTSLSLTVTVDKPQIFLGEVFTLEVTSDGDLDACDVTVQNMEGFTVTDGFYRGCTYMVVGTSTSWVPGDHMVRVKASASGVEGSAGVLINFMGSGYIGGEEPLVEPEQVMPGNEVYIHLDPSATCDFTRIELLDKNRVRIAEQDTPGCDTMISVQIPASTPPGNVQMNVKQIEDGRVKGISKKLVSVMEWRPLQRTQRYELCHEGVMRVSQHTLPCIGSEDRCFPTTSSLPLCVCFDMDDNAAAVCEYGQRCSRGQCVDTELTKSPYIIVHEDGQCLAKRGLNTMDCLQVGEVCASSCVCLDHTSRPISSCSFGETCTPDSCRKVELVLRIEDPPMDHVRADELRDGIRLTWHGHIKSEGSFLREDVQDALEVRALIGDVEGSDVSARYLDEEKGWEFTAKFAPDLAPGRYDAFLLVTYRDAMQLARSAFYVWYPEHLSKLDLVTKNVNPTSVSAKQLRTGVSVKAMVRVLDAQGNDVDDLPQESFEMLAGELNAVAVSAKYQPISGLWEVVGTFRSIQTANSGTLTVRLSRLGREGQAVDAFSIVDRVPLDLRIIKVSPGTADEPLFYALVAMGFTMDVFMQLRGGDTLTPDSFTVKIHDKQLPPENLIDMISTAEGIQLKLGQVDLCPDVPPPDTPVPIEVTASTADETATDRFLIYLEGNPGDWNNLEEAGCI